MVIVLWIIFGALVGRIASLAIEGNVKKGASLTIFIGVIVAVASGCF